MGGLTVLSINTIIYSVFHSPAAEVPPEDPFHQFAWLRSRLQAAAEQNRTVWIVGHVPPGIETFGYSELWRPSYVERYLGIVQDPVLGPRVAAQLFGHVHKEELRVLPNAPVGAGPIILSGSISPIFMNNPSLRFVEYDPVTQRPVRYQELFTEMPEGSQSPEWRFGYDLLDAYGVLKKGVDDAGALLHSHVESLADRLEDGLGDWDAYASWYATQVQNVGPLDLMACSSTGKALNRTARLACRKRYRCAMTVSTQEQFNACAGASAWLREGQRLSAPLLRQGQGPYYRVQREQWAAELTGERARAERQRQALAGGRWREVEAWASGSSGSILV
ncbi:unnamed protein product [Prorocentrum cordatum]|uniref:Calcineurin-like phosphoesterase domain-containing protein n=1 Tax=Prorocentrum cordatum TaxID=2364126 RepID=A0ABN9V2Q1_9DINO|nr:unnamed protein product [Polarella glacialis]|mmetsp:Transcript_96005/g.250089  ORF Transcript_96005/g.250089 Transcript_96005/m.250089 type:complete len:334 (-) Transcript_96005:64-1065(-)